jgi:hypothetical protein
MGGTWTAGPVRLKALADFLEGLAELTARTSVMACAYNATEVEIGDGTVLRINSARDSEGAVTYYVDEISD